MRQVTMLPLEFYAAMDDDGHPRTCIISDFGGNAAFLSPGTAASEAPPESNPAHTSRGATGEREPRDGDG